MSIRIFPFPKRLDQKWWHRLSKVLIFVAGGVAVLIGILATWMAIEAGKIEHELYNFEGGYSSNPHEAKELTQWNATYDFLDRLLEASKDRVSQDREWIPKEGLSFDEMRGTGLYKKSDWELKDDILEWIESGKSSDPWRIKIWYEYSYFPEILWLLFGPIIYLILVGLYGVVLYIAYGSNPFKQ